MRRSDREIKNFDEIVDVLNRADTIRLGINANGSYPYVVPLSFGFEIAEQEITIYIHGAKEGLKHELLAADNRVCVEASIFHRFTELSQYKALTTEYESFIGYGKAEIANDKTAVRGLDLICEHAGFKNFDYGGENALIKTRVYKIKIESFTGKRRLLEN